METTFVSDTDFNVCRINQPLESFFQGQNGDVNGVLQVQIFNETIRILGLIF